MVAKKVSGHISLRPVRKKHVTLRIRGISPMIQHQWGGKALDMIRAKKQGKKTKDRVNSDPEREAEEATYRTEQGDFGCPLTAIKSSIISAAHKDIGFEKTLVKKSVFIVCADPKGILRMECSQPELREDPVRVGMGSADLRYRPMFVDWSITVNFEIDEELLKLDDLVTLLDRAGFGIGIGEWRPEKGGDYGRFEVDTTFPVTEEKVT